MKQDRKSKVVNEIFAERNVEGKENERQKLRKDVAGEVSSEGQLYSVEENNLAYLEETLEQNQSKWSKEREEEEFKDLEKALKRADTENRHAARQLFTEEAPEDIPPRTPIDSKRISRDVRLLEEKFNGQLGKLLKNSNTKLLVFDESLQQICTDWVPYETERISSTEENEEIQQYMENAKSHGKLVSVTDTPVAKSIVKSFVLSKGGSKELFKRSERDIDKANKDPEKILNVIRNVREETESPRKSNPEGRVRGLVLRFTNKKQNKRSKVKKYQDTCPILNKRITKEQRDKFLEKQRLNARRIKKANPNSPVFVSMFFDNVDDDCEM